MTRVRDVGGARQVIEHTCHAKHCTARCPPERLMCLAHWRMVPKALQNAVWATYRPGQCQDMNPSEDWFKAANAAILAVYEKEKKTT